MPRVQCIIRTAYSVPHSFIWFRKSVAWLWTTEITSERNLRLHSNSHGIQPSKPSSKYALFLQASAVIRLILNCADPVVASLGSSLQLYGQATDRIPGGLEIHIQTEQFYPNDRRSNAKYAHSQNMSYSHSRLPQSIVNHIDLPRAITPKTWGSYLSP